MYKATLALIALAQLSLSAPIAPRQASPCDGQVNGPGICLQNSASSEQTFSFFQNTGDSNGAAFPAKDPVEGLDTVVPAGESRWVSLALDFKGRVQRTKLYPSTWAEFQIQDTLTVNHTPDFKAHGDISLIQGNDGAAEIAALDGSGQKNGFSQDLISGAPQAALYTRAEDGKVVLANTEFAPFPFIDGNPDALAWEESQLGTTAPMKAYTRNNSPVADVSSSNNALLFTFY